MREFMSDAVVLCFFMNTPPTDRLTGEFRSLLTTTIAKVQPVTDADAAWDHH
jgi:hypothetical protein